MNAQSNSVTALVRSIRRNLKAHHHVDVPHAALRAALLQAQGEHPHAQAAKQSRLDELTQLVNEAPKFFHPGYDFDGEKLAWLERAGLASAPHSSSEQPTGPIIFLRTDPEDGVELILSLDADGNYPVPDFLELSAYEAHARHLHALIPKVKKYGVPTYITSPAETLRTLRLAVHRYFGTSYKDSGDDTADYAAIQLDISKSNWNRLMGLLLNQVQGLSVDIAEWVGQHYQVNFDKEPISRRIDWADRFLQSLSESELENMSYPALG